MKIVKRAKIEVVTIDNLREGDEILWSNLRCKVVNVNMWQRSIIFVPYSMPDSATEGSYMHYYRIQECEEANICTLCGKEVEQGDICEECKMMENLS